MSAPTTSRLANPVVLALGVFGLATGLLARLLGTSWVASWSWIGATLLGIAMAAWWVVDALCEGRLGVDVIALAALTGSLIVGEHLAGALITMMLATGRSLEGWAAGRAERELHALLARAPQVAHRYIDGALTEPALEEIGIGDLLLVRPGEVVPVDGLVRAGPAIVDESALTGESVPVERAVGEPVRGGGVNAGGPFDLRATSTAQDSSYAGIVRLVEQASASSSPLVRMADRFAVAFVAVTFATSVAAWLIAADMERAVAVLVVATPCPLILAAPVAIVSGLSRAAHRGVLIKGGGALEALADGRTLLFDKTGTITCGHPAVVDVITADGFESTRVLQLAASLDQISPHILAASIVHAATARCLDLTIPLDADEVAGRGVSGTVGVHRVAVGNGRWTNVIDDAPWVLDARRRSEMEGSSTVFVAVDGVPAGAIILADPIRHDAARTIRNLRRSGITRIVMVTGDRAEVAASVAATVGITEVRAQQSPADKVAVVHEEGLNGATIMVGDGINDAPALAAAGVGVAIGARGSTASSETADIVLTTDRLDRLGEARLIARRSRRIATQSVAVGIGLSFVAMAFAAVGLLPATTGALLQEVIDVAVILNALRALRPGPDEQHLDDSGTLIAQRLTAEHVGLRPQVAMLCDAADALGRRRSDAMVAARRAHTFLVNEVEPHELAEDRDFYPVVADMLGGTDPTSTMSRTHTEISRRTRQLGMTLERIGENPPDVDAVLELQRLLYGLYAVLELHFSQEDENYLSLADPAP